MTTRSSFRSEYSISARKKLLLFHPHPSTRRFPLPFAFTFSISNPFRRIFEKNSPLENPGGFNTDFDPKTGLDSNDCHANARCPRKSSRVIFGIIITFEDGEDGARTTVFFIPLSNGNAGFYCTIESSFGFLSGSR